MSGKRVVQINDYNPSKLPRSSSSPTPSYPLHPLLRPPLNPNSLPFPLSGIDPRSIPGINPALYAHSGIPIDWSCYGYNTGVNINSAQSSQSSFSPTESMPSQIPTEQTPDSQPSQTSGLQIPSPTQPSQTQPSQTQPSQTQPPQTQPPQTQASQNATPIDEVEVLENPPSRTKRTVGFRDSEDLLITELWLKHSEDGITGVEQPRDAFWNKVYDEFQVSTTYVARKQKSIIGRWKLLQNAVNKFCAVYTKNTIKHPSGKSLEDLLAMSLMDFQAAHGTSFKHMAIWDVVKNHPKWLEAQKALVEQARRIAAQKNVINEVAGGDDVVVGIVNPDGSSVSRPPGRDAEKARRKAAQANEAAIKASSETFAQYMAEQKKVNEENAERANTRMKLLHDNGARNDLMVQSALRMSKVFEKKERRKDVDSMTNMMNSPIFTDPDVDQEVVKKAKSKLLSKMTKYLSCLSSSDSD